MKTALLAIGLFVALGGCARELTPGAALIQGTGPVTDFAIPVQSFQDRKFATIVRQRYDFSCGSAALATLLRYHYGQPIDEQAVFRGMWEKGDRAQIRRLGFSLLDMKRFLVSRRMTAEGYKVTLTQVANAGVPGIALVRVGDYRHFVVVKGVSAGEVLVGDPSIGLQVVSRTAFEASWNGVYFVLDRSTPAPSGNFNADAQWASFSRAPVGERLTDPLSMQALSLTAPFYRDF